MIRSFQKRFLAVASALAAFACALLVVATPAFAAPHIVVDLKSGKVISRSQEFDRWFPASLTKLMTAYTVFQEIKRGRISPLSPVKVSARALAQPPSKMGYPEGTVLNIDTAIKIIMVKSANDISLAIAESVAGSEAAFVQLMNANAAKLGMRDTRFVNPHGLHDPGQFTSARDMALLAIALKREFPSYAGYFRIPAIQSGKKILQNHNPLLQRYDGTTGMKTGFVCASGLNIVVSVKRQGRELIAIVLGGPTGQERNVRAARLLTESFAKSGLFITSKLETLQPTGAVNRVPVDMRPVVCGKKKKQQAEDNDEDDGASSAFALREPTLDDLEAKYLKPKGSNTRVIPIVLGNATGPDPFGLVAADAQSGGSGLTAFSAADGASTPWPVMPGAPKVKVPVPVWRPSN